MSSRALLSVRGLGAAWSGSPVLTDVSFDVGEREFVVLMGPNGSGKTTLLRAIAGFEPIISGEIDLAGRPISRRPAHQRGIGLLFQEPSLFPRRTVWENIAYGLEVARRPPDEVRARVAALVELLHLGGLEARASSELSGGERQRVALARTLAPGPSLVLLDEPFASVDAEIRGEMRAEFRRVLDRLGVAAIHVTHDREEGLFLGDRVLLLERGRILQSGSPDAVFRAPATAGAARFLGYNLLRDGDRSLAVHPREIELSDSGPGAPAEIEASGIVGDERSYLLRLDSGERIEARCREPLVGASRGARVRVRWTRSIPLPETDDRSTRGT